MRRWSEVVRWTGAGGVGGLARVPQDAVKGSIKRVTERSYKDSRTRPRRQRAVGVARVNGVGSGGEGHGAGGLVFVHRLPEPSTQLAMPEGGVVTEARSTMYSIVDR